MADTLMKNIDGEETRFSATLCNKNNGDALIDVAVDYGENHLFIFQSEIPYLIQILGQAMRKNYEKEETEGNN